MFFKCLFLLSFFLFMGGISEQNYYQAGRKEGRYPVTLEPALFAIGLMFFLFGLFGIIMPPHNG